MKIILKELILENFRGVTGSFEFNEGRNVFSGPNGSGKTTLFDSVQWLLTGKDSQGRADFDIKTIVDGQALSRTDHSVTATYEIDGQRREFGRKFFEKWSKKRGDTEQTKDGNQTAYAVDGIDVTKTKYQTAIAGAFGTHYEIVSDLSAIATMPWKARRDLLVAMVPDVDQKAVIDSVAGLRDLMGERSLDDAKTAADQRRKKIGKDIEEIPGKIAEHQRILENAGGISQQQADAAVSDAENAIGKAQIAIDNFSSGDKSEDIEKLKALNLALMESETGYETAKNAAQTAETSRQNDIRIIENELKNQRENLQDHSDAITELRIEYSKIRSSVPDDIKTVCSECGQDLPAEKVEQLKADFMSNRAEKLADNQARGKDMAAEIKRIQAKISEREAELQQVQEKAVEMPAEPEKIADLKKQIEALKTPDQVKEVPAELTATLEACKARLTNAQETRAAIKSTADSQKRIDELTAKKAELSAENDRVNKFLALYDQYTKAMADAVEKPVNDLFETAYFQMFDVLEKMEDGKQKQVEACIVMDKARRSYDGALSNGEKIQVGLDIVRTMQLHFGVSPCVWIDNAESLTSKIELDCQFVELKANSRFSNLTKGE